MIDQNSTHTNKLITFRLSGQDLGLDILAVREIRVW